MDDRNRRYPAQPQPHPQSQPGQPAAQRYGDPNDRRPSQRPSSDYSGYYDASYGQPMPYAAPTYGDPPRSAYPPHIMYGAPVPYATFPSQQGSREPAAPTSIIQGSSFYPMDGSHQPVPYQQPMAYPQSLLNHPAAVQAHSMPPPADVGDRDDNSTPQMSPQERQRRMNQFEMKMAVAITALKRYDFAGCRDYIQEICTWFTVHVEPLGIHIDNQELREERLEMWRNFNNLWLGLLQIQYDMVTGMYEVPPRVRLFTLQDYKLMGNNLVRFASTMEAHGLVDYEYGVWEDQITQMIVKIVKALSP